jgi:hypothetical protein
MQDYLDINYQIGLQDEEADVQPNTDPFAKHRVQTDMFLGCFDEQETIEELNCAFDWNNKPTRNSYFESYRHLFNALKKNILNENWLKMNALEIQNALTKLIPIK